VQSGKAVQEARAEIALGFFHGTFATAPGAAPHPNCVRLTLFLPVIYSFRPVVFSCSGLLFPADFALSH
jgi:hypothetical protein